MAALLQGVPTIRIAGPPPDATVSKTDSHLNEAGNRYVMEGLARSLAERMR